MSDGIMFCFANCNRENMDPLPLIRVLSLAKFPLPAISYFDGQSKSANEKDKIEHEEMEPLIREFLDVPSKLDFLNHHWSFSLFVFMRIHQAYTTDSSEPIAGEKHATRWKD